MAQEDEDDQRPVTPRPGGGVPGSGGRAGEGVRIIGAQEAAQREAELQSGRLPDDALRYGDVPPPPSGPRPSVRFPLPEDAPAQPVSAPAASPDLPHWSEPPTGEVPKILAGDAGAEDDLEAWAALRRQPRWREGNDWEEADFEGDELRAAEEERMGALDDRHRAPEFSFDDEDEDEFEEMPEPRGRLAARARTAAPPAEPRRVSSRPSTPEPFDYGDRRNGDRDLPLAIGVGIGIGVIALLAFWRGPGWAAALATVIVLVAAVEVFDNFRRAGLRPATLLGIASTAALMVGSYVKGERAMPLVLALTVMFTMLWYLVGVVRARATVNVGATLLGVLWVGFLGSFASLMLRYPNDEGVAFLFGAVLAVVANDVGALFAGRSFGHTPLMPAISPNKTVEGFFGGFLLTLIVSLALVGRMHPWTFGATFWLAVVVSLIAPAGDLVESMVKRDLGVKDMGTIVPGHGGVLDRFDAILFTLPAVYYLVDLLNLPGA